MNLGSYKTVVNKVMVYKGTELESILAREGKLVKQGFVYDFEFDDPRVALVYDLAKKELEPLHEVDTACKRIQFKMDNIAIHPPKAPERAKLETAFNDIQRRMNSQLAALMRSIISFAEKNHGADRRTRQQFEQEVRDIVSANVDSNLKFLDRMEPELETLMGVMDGGGLGRRARKEVCYVG